MLFASATVKISAIRVPFVLAPIGGIPALGVLSASATGEIPAHRVLFERTDVSDLVVEVRLFPTKLPVLLTLETVRPTCR